MSVEADTDGDTSNNSITVPVSVMTYTDDRYALAGLDSQTTIDEGDFISFYTGTLQDDGTLSEGGAIQGYVRITSVVKSEENYIVTYEAVSLTELQESMSAYKKENVAVKNCWRRGQKALEENVEQQARQITEEADVSGALALETIPYKTQR